MTAPPLSPAARRRLEEAWLAILRERHPGREFEIVRPADEAGDDHDDDEKAA